MQHSANATERVTACPSSPAPHHTITSHSNIVRRFNIENCLIYLKVMATSVVPLLGALAEGLVAHREIELAPPPEGHHHQPLLPENIK